MKDESVEGGKALQAYKEVSKSLGQQLSQIGATLRAAIVDVSEFIAKWSGLKVVLGLLNSFVQVKSDFTTLIGAFKTITGPIVKVTLGVTTLFGSLLLLNGIVLRMRSAIKLLSFAKLAETMNDVGKNSNFAMRGLKAFYITMQRGGTGVMAFIPNLFRLGSALKDYVKSAIDSVLATHKMNVATRTSAFYTIAYKNAVASAKVTSDALTSAQTRLANAAKVAAASFKAFIKATIILALIAVAIQGLSKAWDYFKTKIDDAKAAAMDNKFSHLAQDIDKLKTVTQVETRIKALNARLEELSNMSQTASVKALTEQYQAAIEKLNQKKMDLTAFNDSGEVFKKLEEAQRKMFDANSNSFQQMTILQQENRELSSQLAMLPRASSAWAKMATKITENTIKIKQLANSLRDMYDFIPKSIFDDVDEKFGDSTKGTSEKIKLKQEQISKSLAAQGMSPAQIQAFLSQVQPTQLDFRTAKGSMTGALTIRESLLSRVQQAMGAGMQKTTGAQYVTQLSSDLNALGVSGFNTNAITKNAAEIANVIGNLNADIQNASLSTMNSEDRTNELLTLHQKRLMAIVQLKERLVSGDKNATTQQKASLEASKKELQAWQDKLKDVREYKELSNISASSMMDTNGILSAASNIRARYALESRYKSDSDFRAIAQEQAKKLNIRDFDFFLKNNMGVMAYSKETTKALQTALELSISRTVSNISMPSLKTTKDQAASIGKYNFNQAISKDVMKLVNEMHQLQFKQNKQLNEAYKNTYGSTYDAYAQQLNASKFSLSGAGTIRDPFKDIQETVAMLPVEVQDGLEAAGSVLKNAGVLTKKGLDINAPGFRDALTRAAVQAQAVGGTKAVEMLNKTIAALTQYTDQLKNYDKTSRMYVDALGSNSDKLALLKQDNATLKQEYTNALKTKDSGKIAQVGEKLFQNEVAMTRLIRSMSAGKAVPVSEQVSWSSKEAYSLMYAQSTKNRSAEQMYKNVGDINSNLKKLAQIIQRDVRASASNKQANTLNLVGYN